MLHWHLIFGENGIYFPLFKDNSSFFFKKTFNAWSRGGNKFKEKPSSLSATTRRSDSDDTKSIEAIERNELVNVLTEIISKQNL